MRSRSSAHERRPLYSHSDGASTRRDRCSGQPLRRTPRGGEGGGRLQREHAAERPRAVPRGVRRCARSAGRSCATSSTSVDRGPIDGGRATGTAPVDRAADAAEAGADDARRRTLRGDVETLTADLGDHQAELAKLELAERTLERTWLFLERGDATLLTDVGGPTTAGDVQMRIVEAQEAERSRLAQEIHDGPAQALSNAIFQVEYIEQVIDSDPMLARTELRFLRELLRRELGDVRTFISQLRPPMLDRARARRRDHRYRRNTCGR